MTKKSEHEKYHTPAAADRPMRTGKAAHLFDTWLFSWQGSLGD
jgi:hypothetical protein